MVQGWVDTMMIGCALALLKGQPRWEQIHRRWLNGWTASGMAVIGFLLMPALLLLLPHLLSSLVGLGIKPTVLAVCIGGILVYLVEHPESFVGRILNNPIVRHIGVLSYSLYLWQQLFMSEELPMLPYGFLFALAAAEFSYWVVERPSLNLRARLERRYARTQLTPGS
jgi:peptidoglycan/LPS O-acetylase OafA/YrhL